MITLYITTTLIPIVAGTITSILASIKPRLTSYWLRLILFILLNVTIAVGGYYGCSFKIINIDQLSAFVGIVCNSQSYKDFL